MNILITGASTGLGREFARISARDGHNVILVARSEDKLKLLKDELESNHSIDAKIVRLDLTMPNASSQLEKMTIDDDVDVLINNAGFGYVSEFLVSDISKQLNMIDLNIKSLVELTHIFGNQFKQKGSGKILNIASVAGYIPGPNQPVYYASKSFVRSFSHAVAHKLKGTGVSLTILNPGYTKTEFFNNAKAGGIMDGGDDANKVAQYGYDALMKGKREVIYGLSNKLTINLFSRIISPKIQAGMIDRVSQV